MWFKRKKKTDADTALSETLVSLQSLLDEKTRPAEKNVSTASSTGERPSSTELTLDNVSPLSSGNNISNAVASDEHLEWDFKVDLAVEDAPAKAPAPGFLKPVESDTVTESTVPDSSAVVPIHRNREPAAEATANGLEPGAGDLIPVLVKIIEAGFGGAEENADLENNPVDDAFVNQCLKDIRKRLKRNELTPLTPIQERQFRKALMSLLIQKKSGKFE